MTDPKATPGIEPMVRKWCREEIANSKTEHGDRLFPLYVLESQAPPAAERCAECGRSRLDALKWAVESFDLQPSTGEARHLGGLTLVLSEIKRLTKGFGSEVPAPDAAKGFAASHPSHQRDSDPRPDTPKGGGCATCGVAFGEPCKDTTPADAAKSPPELPDHRWLRWDSPNCIRLEECAADQPGAAQFDRHDVVEKRVAEAKQAALDHDSEAWNAALSALSAHPNDNLVEAARRVVAGLAAANRRADSYEEQWRSNLAFTKQASDDAKKAEASLAASEARVRELEGLRRDLNDHFAEAKASCELLEKRAEAAEAERDEWKAHAEADTKSLDAANDRADRAEAKMRELESWNLAGRSLEEVGQMIASSRDECRRVEGERDAAWTAMRFDESRRSGLTLADVCEQHQKDFDEEIKARQSAWDALTVAKAQYEADAKEMAELRAKLAGYDRVWSEVVAVYDPEAT